MIEKLIAPIQNPFYNAIAELVFTTVAWFFVSLFSMYVLYGLSYRITRGILHAIEDHKKSKEKNEKNEKTKQ